MVYLVQIYCTYLFQHCPATGMKKDDKGSSSIILAGRALLVKMLINLEPSYAFGSNFEYFFLFFFSFSFSLFFAFYVLLFSYIFLFFLFFF